MSGSPHPKNPAHPAPRDSWIVPAAIMLVAVLVRWVYLRQVSHLILYQEATGDAAQYLKLAGQIRADGFWAPHGAAYFQAPFYPWYLWALHGPEGSLGPARLLQFAAGVMGALLAWSTARRLGGALAGIVAGFAAALYGPRLFFEGELLSVTWALLFLQVAAWALVLESDTAAPWTLPAAGLAVALAALSQPNALLVGLVVLAWLVFRLFRTRQASRSARLRGCVAFAIALFLPLLPVLFRNHQESGDWVLISANGGVNFYIGNNPDADGSFHIPAGAPLVNDPEGLISSSTDAASRALGRPAGPGAVSGYWLGLGLSWWSRQPLAAAALLARKTLYFLSGTEIPNHYDLSFFRDLAPVLRVLPGFLLLVPLALWGAVTTARRSAGRPLLLVGGAYAVSVIVFFVTDRYRLPVMAAAFPLAGLGVADLRGMFRRRESSALVAAGTVVLAFLVLASVRLVDTKPARAHMHNLLGTLYYRRNELAAAEAAFTRALSMDPGSAEAMNNLGRTALLAGHASEAESRFREALKISPELAEGYFNLEELLRNSGRSAEALSTLEALRAHVAGADERWGGAIHYRRGLNSRALGDTAAARREWDTSLRLKPDLAGAQAALGALDLMEGNRESARRHFAEAAHAAPSVWTYHDRLGLVAGELGDYPAALAAFDEAARLAPDRPEIGCHRAVVLIRAGRRAEGLAALESLAAGRFGPALYQLGLASEAAGDRRKAAESYRKAVAAGGLSGPEAADAVARLKALEERS